MFEPINKEAGRAQIRRTFLAGILAFVPLAITVYIVWFIDQQTRIITRWLFHKDIPFLGMAIGLAAIYFTGMVATSLVGRFLLHWLDRILLRLPVVSQLYQAWKQIALTPGGTEGTFSRVVLIPDETRTMKFLGFTSGRIVEADEPMYCVFVPSSPNPITGRLYLVPVDKCQMIQMTPEEALKVVLSTGNYVPPLVPMKETAAIVESKAEGPVI